MNLESIEIATYSYIGLDLFCAFIMGILFYTTFLDSDHTSRRIHLLNALFGVFICCLADTFWIMSYNGVIISRSIASRYLSNVVVYFFMTFCAYAICRFLLSIWESVNPVFTPKKRLLIIPYAIFEVLILSTYWTHLIFSISPDGDLIPGIFYIPLMVLFFGSVLFLGIVSFFFYLGTQNDFSKEQFFLVAIYTIPVIIGGYTKYRFWLIPGFSIGFTIATFIIYIFQMRDMISQDALTGIMNRRRGERFFLEQIKRINDEPHSTIDCLYLFMMDLNKFKSINDTYGHTEGDRALIATAEVLKEACSHIRRRCIMSRFGGDEFVIGVVFTPEEAQLLNEKIQHLIEEKNRQMNKPYKISISIGYTYYKKEFKDFTTFLASADKLMYNMKEIAHAREESKPE